MAKKLKEKTVRTHAIDAIGSQDKDSDILNSMIGAAPAKLKGTNPDPFGDDLKNMDDFGPASTPKKKRAKPSQRPDNRPTKGANQELNIKSPPKKKKLVDPFGDDLKNMDDFGKAPKKKYADSGQRPQGGAKSRSKSAAKAKAKGKAKDTGFKSYGKAGTSLGDFSRKYGIKYATQEQMDKDFDLSDGEKAGGRPGRGKMKTQGMNKKGKRKAGFSGKGAGAALRGF